MFEGEVLLSVSVTSYNDRREIENQLRTQAQVLLKRYPGASIILTTNNEERIVAEA